MTKIIASDFDGTLFKTGKISKENIEAIGKFRSCGNLFGIVTGRDYKSLKRELDVLGFSQYDFLILCNGAVCCNENDEFVFEDNVDAKMTWGGSTLAKQICNRLFELDSYCGISFGKENYLFHRDFPEGGSDDIYTYHSHKLIENASEFCRMFGRCKTSELSTKVTQILTEEFGEVVNPTQNGTAIDIPAVGINKASGIKKYAGLMNVAIDNVWTVGDNFNDIPMFDGFHSCLMGDGEEKLKCMVDFVCDNVSDYIEIVLKH